MHADFVPADKHKDKYKDQQFVFPKSMAKPDEPAQHRPMWAQNQRNSWHGVEYPYHSDLDIAEYYKRYMRDLRWRRRQHRPHTRRFDALEVSSIPR